MKGSSKLTRFGALALIAAVAAVSWFAHRGNAFTLIERPAEELSGLVSFIATQDVRANVFNRSDNPVTATIKFWDANGNTVETPVDVVLEPLHGLSVKLGLTNPNGAPAITFGEDGTALVRAGITVNGANAAEENANLAALFGHLEVFDARDGSTKVAVPMASYQTGGSGRSAPTAE
jgi:hypothetical protein